MKADRARSKSGQAVAYKAATHAALVAKNRSAEGYRISNIWAWHIKPDRQVALREALKAGVPKPLTTADLAAAAATLKPTTKEWFATARNHALYSNQGGTYDDILKYLKLT